ncbi:YihY/virulence factor BrkB family protein [Parapedobacter indicus]|uniref:Membrane protein n=1 Tax=Parapedobacter indicus TaxID=1477437 RepID=A0A1I3CR06_9SPHI|nr:YihY/virulence factor BrkB family protein [Parapedobacter indicus]PPL04360.1 membrane protein [Parapedobacter indicus]SFH76917.1 membrane protein [Parapedobacter indicus]
MRLFKKSFYKDIFQLLSNTFSEFSNDNAMKMSASLAYYTIFSIAPLLLIVIWLVGFFYGQILAGEHDAQSAVFEEFAAIFGPATAAQIQQIIQNIGLSNKSGIGIAVGIGTLILGSTTIFTEIQDSLNRIWGVRPKPKKGWLKMLLNRAISFSMVLGLGFLLIVSLIANGIIVALSSQITRFFPEISVYLVEWVNIGLTFIVITSLFAFIFRFLPDARMRFRDVAGGAIFTAALFMLGRYLISLYMQYSAPASAYGAAGAIIILLLWVYYSAAILYFGAEFTKVYALRYGRGVWPSSYAVKVVMKEEEVEDEPLELPSRPNTGQNKES